MTEINKRREVALLGGAFNPVTRGHIQIAECVLEAGGIADEVWLMPCYSHVYAKKMESAAHRLAMCRLAVAEKPGIKVTAYEIETRAESGTYYLMKQFYSDPRYRDLYRFSMIIGQDNANGFPNWIRNHDLQNLVRFIVIPRPGVPGGGDRAWYHNPPHISLEKDCEIMDVSSTLVRELVKESRWEKVARLVSPGVLEYIRSHRLYAG